MRKSIKIPRDKIYVNEFTDTLPSGILSKGKTGVGVTSLALENDENYVIAVPFIALIENKINQYPTDKILGIYSENKSKELISNYLENDSQPKKIMVTYDSLPYLIDCLGGDVSEYKILIDEYHLLFLQYSFRKKAVQGILQNYTRFKDFTFVSATPLEDEFILEELKGLPHTEYIWERDTTVKVISVKCRKDVLSTVVYLVQRFLDGEIKGNAYFFINSVSFISDVLDAVPLNNSNCRAIYSKSNNTSISIKRGTTSDEPKLVNFITSCCFEGCDIYDPDGKIYVVSDGKKAHTLVDISTSFQQIIGRLRNTKYWNTIHHIFTETRYYGISSFDDFKAVSNKDIEDGKEIEVFVNQGKSRIREQLETTNCYLLKDEEDYFSFDPNLVKVDLFNYKLTSCIYNLQANIQKELERYSYNVELDTDRCTSEVIISDLISENFKEVVLQLKEFYPPGDKPILRDELDIQHCAFKKYPYLKIIIDQLGYEYIEKQNYRTDNLKRKAYQLVPRTLDELIMEELRSDFFVNYRGVMTNQMLKLTFECIYANLGLSKKAKAKDIEKYYYCKRSSVWDKHLKKTVMGYKIIKPKFGTNTQK